MSCSIFLDRYIAKTFFPTFNSYALCARYTRKLEVEVEIDTAREMTKKKNKGNEFKAEADADAMLTSDEIDAFFQPSPIQTHEQQTTQTDTKTKRTNTKKSKHDKITDNWTRNNTHTTFFIERIQPNENEQNNNIPSQNQNRPKPIHQMELAKILFSVGLKSFKELKFADQSKFRVTFHQPKDAEVLINSKLFKEEFKFNMYVQKHLQETIGIVRNVATTFTDDEILKWIQKKNNKVTKVERIQRMTSTGLKPTYSIKIFVQGPKLPKDVEIYGLTEDVDIYVFPLKLCNRCLRYGHKEKNCKAKQPRCPNCGMDHVDMSCNNQAQCVHCSGNHSSLDKSCPERVRQDQIRYLMATEKLTFTEAATHFPKNSQTQPRLQSFSQFPFLPQKQNLAPIETANSQTFSQIIQNQQTPTTSQNTNQTQNNPQNPSMQPSDFIPISEVNKIVHAIKTELIRQLKLDTIIAKINEIQNTIAKHNEQHSTQTDSIDSEMLFTQISSQINSIISPQVILSDSEIHPTQATLTWSGIET